MSDQVQDTADSLKRKHENDDMLDDQNETNLELDESYVTMIDVLNEEEKLEEDANAVLGGSDDKNCTYELGYINRQALYSCRTCMGDNPNEDSEDIFGICLACSYACHADHDLFELYTKRGFRCDCGASKMKNNCCTLYPAKDSLNEKNKYNQNFVGKYCLCAKPYPNPDGKDEEMVQCVVCEDWFHSNCLGCSFPDDEDYAEMICKNCMQNNNFLRYYQTEKVKIKNDDSKAIVDVVGETKTDEVKDDQTNEVEQKVSNNGEALNEPAVESTTEPQVAKEESEVVKNGHNSTESTTGDAVKEECKLKSLKLKLNIECKQGTTFWDEGWRSQLCKCEECLNLYVKNKVEFLIDETDTVHYYEAKGKEKCKEKLSQYERGLNEINKMDRVAGIEAIMGMYHKCILRIIHL